MQQHTKHIYTATHTWLGVIAGILLFIVTFSGFPAMFAHELELWQSPALTNHQPAENTDLDRVISSARQQGFDHSDFFILPSEEHGYVMLFHSGESDHDFDMRYISLHDFTELDAGESEMAHIFEHLHTDLHLPRPFGRYLVGLAGMVMLLSIIAGIVIHTKWRKEFVMLRPKRSWRLMLTDHHKLLGLWTLPFSFILAFTGTILGLLGLISPILALAKFDGDVEKATIAVLGPRAEIVGEAAAPVSINQLYIESKKTQPELDVAFIQVEGLGDAGGVIKFSGNNQHHLSNLQSLTYTLKDGKQIHELNGVEKGPFQRIFAAVTPLHYVLFGDFALKVFYAISTLALCALIVSGNMIWLSKKQQTQQEANPGSEQNLHLLARLTLGICAGLILTSAATLSASQWLQGLTEQHHYEEGIFWGVWLLGIAYALAGNKLHHKTRIYLIASAALLLSTIIGDGVINQRWTWNSNELVVAIHTSLLALALVCGYFGWRLPRSDSKTNRPAELTDQVAQTA